jgi:hypothetical protein
VSAATEPQSAAKAQWERIEALLAVFEVRCGTRADLTEAQAVERCRQVMPDFGRGRDAPSLTLIQGGRED